MLDVSCFLVISFAVPVYNVEPCFLVATADSDNKKWMRSDSEKLLYSMFACEEDENVSVTAPS